MPSKDRLSHARLKSRSGCLTCKYVLFPDDRISTNPRPGVRTLLPLRCMLNTLVGRRVKCDEAKPYCQRCTSTGRKCDGYGTLNLLPSSHRDLTTLSSPPALMRSSGNARESRSFQYFYERTVPSLAGYCGSEFWNRLVLQVSQHEKSVWHALIALGSLHENFENDQQIPGLRFSRRGQDSFAVQEYNFAIRALLGRSNPVGMLPANLAVDVCLISCILFACFEVSLGPAFICLANLTGPLWSL